MFESLKRFRPSMSAAQAHDIVFNALYTFSMPGLAVFDFEEAQRRGIPTSGDRGKDYAISTGETTRIISLAQAADIMASGFRICLVRKEFAIEAYNALQAHLEHWVNYIDSFSMHGGEAPVEDLIKLENLCSSIFAVARLQMKQQGVDHLWGASVDFSKVGTDAVFDIMNIERKVNPKATGVELFGKRVNEQTDGYPIRNSLTSLLDRETAANFDEL